MSQINVIGKVVIQNLAGETQSCRKTGCFNFVFLKCDDGQVRCNLCNGVHLLNNGDVLGQFPIPKNKEWNDG